MSFMKNILGGMMDFVGLGDLWNSVTGSGLTSAEIQQNEFNAAEAQKARDFNAGQAQIQRDWQTQMDNTKVQRSVDDMKAAGVNPAMMMGGSGVTASTPSGAAASGPAASGSSHGANPGALLDLLFAKQRFDATKAQINNVKAQTDNLKAETANKEADTFNKQESTRGLKISNDFLEQTFEDRKESVRLANDLSRSQRRSIERSLDVMDGELNLKIEQAKSEEEKRNLMVSQEILNYTNAENVVKMRPYLQAELSAKTDQERAYAHQAAVAAAYQDGMIRAGAIEAAIRASNANASVQEVESALKKWSLDLKEGRAVTDSGVAGNIVSALYQGLSQLSSAGLSGLKL